MCHPPSRKSFPIIVSPTLLGQPVLTALLAVPLLGESVSGFQVIGGALVLGGIWLVHRR